MQKRLFLNNLGLLFSARGKVLNSFKSRLFPIKKFRQNSKTRTYNRTSNKPEVATEPTKLTKDKTKRKISSLKLHENFLNENKNEDKNINEQIFNEFFNYHYPSFLVRDLYKDNQNKIVKKRIIN